MNQVSLTQLLTEGVLAFQRNDIDACKRYVIEYYQRINKGEVQPVTVKNNVHGSDIAKALLTLINSRMYPVDIINTTPRGNCDACES